MKQECVFEIGAEGGSITIYREIRKTETIYIYNHNETDFSDSGLDVAIRNEYESFGEAFDKIHRKYEWQYLYLLTIHNDYKELIIDRLLDKINSPKDEMDNQFYERNQFEQLLGVKFDMDKITEATGYYNINIKPIDYTLSHSPQLFKELEIEGKIEIQYQSILIYDLKDHLAFIFPSDKFFISTLPIYKTECKWVVYR